MSKSPEVAQFLADHVGSNLRRLGWRLELHDFFKNAPQPMSPLRYDSGLYIPVYRGDTTRIIIEKGRGTISVSLVSLLVVCV